LECHVPLSYLVRVYGWRLETLLWHPMILLLNRITVMTFVISEFTLDIENEAIGININILRYGYAINAMYLCLTLVKICDS